MFYSRLFAALGLATALMTAATAPAAAQAALGKQVREACQADYKALCNGVQPGGGRVLKCLQEHQDQVSKECLSALEQAKAARSGAQ